MAIFGAKSLSLFYRELSTLLYGGMPVVQAMAELVGHVRYGAFRNTVWHIQADIEQGTPLAAAFAKFPRFFPEWQVGMIDAGERSGKLAESMKMIADQLEKSYADVLKLCVGLSYPLFMLAISLLALPFMRFGGCRTGGCIWKAYAPVFIFAAVCAGGYAAVRKAGQGVRTGLQAAILAVPLFGRLLRQLAVTRFIRALHALTSAGVPILTGWKVAAGAAGNEAVRRELLQSMKVMEAGGTITAALTRSKVFPEYMTGMIASGEMSGSIAKMLDSAAAFCEKENDAAIGVILRVAPVVVYLAVAGFIGSMVISSYADYFGSITNLQ
jgi:type IV pilus assembly protein PilC